MFRNGWTEVCLVEIHFLGDGHEKHGCWFEKIAPVAVTDYQCSRTEVKNMTSFYGLLLPDNHAQNDAGQAKYFCITSDWKERKADKTYK